MDPGISIDKDQNTDVSTNGHIVVARPTTSASVPWTPELRQRPKLRRQDQSEPVIHGKALPSSFSGMRRSESWSERALGLKPTLPHTGVPLVFREPHVYQGFRPLNHGWLYYIKTVFQLHNESMNVWTHLLACLLHLAKLIEFSKEVDFVGDSYTWPLLAGLLCGMALYACSSAAHCLQSRSELTHYTAFMFDYSGIGLYGLGSVILHLAYCSQQSFYAAVEGWFVPLGAMLGFSIYFCCTMAKLIYSRPYPFAKKILQMTPVASIYVLLVSPILHRIFSCAVYGTECTDSIAYHVRQICWFCVSGLFFASEFPQSLAPGWFDHFFHSHQLFHIAIMICTLTQMDGVFIDFKTRQHVIRARKAPTFASALGPVLVVVFAELVCIVYFYMKVKARLDAQHREERFVGQGSDIGGILEEESPSDESHEEILAQENLNDSQEDGRLLQNENINSNVLFSIGNDKEDSSDAESVSLKLERKQ